MKILLIDTGSYTLSDLYAKLSGMGVTCRIIPYSYDHEDWELKYRNERFEEVLRRELGSGFDAVMTTNFFPLVARICHEADTPYLSWSYDSPMNLPLIEEMDHPTNHVFLFDKKDAEKYRSMGLDHFHHLPLAVNCDRLDRICMGKICSSDVSFVGQLYNSTLPMLKSMMGDDYRAFVEKIVETQLKIYGNWFVDQMLTDAIIDDINRGFASRGAGNLQVTREQLAYSIAQQITYMERLSLLKLISGRGVRVDLYTGSLSDAERELLDGVNVHGRISYDKEMPAVFASSRINLCPALKIIQSGIPLRALDIMGCGGFLLSSFQPELDDYFTDGEEVVMYKGLEEAAEKTQYYLAHEDERQSIARKGYEKVRNNFRYEDRIAEMFRVSGLQA